MPQGARFPYGPCRYAAEPLPSGNGSVQGILDYFNGEFSLRITNREFFFD